MSDIINKKEIIDIVDDFYNSIHFKDSTRDICFLVETKKGLFGYFKTDINFKKIFTDSYNQIKILINKNNNIDYRIFEIIDTFLFALSRLLFTPIVKVRIKNDIYEYSEFFKKVKINFIVNLSFPNINSQGKIITKNTIESLREHHQRFKNLDLTDVPNITKFEFFINSKTL